jgi:alpha-mannosidase
MRITLLHSPTMPDPTADFGEHQFKYSLYLHPGPWDEQTQREAYLLNDPVVVYRSEVKSEKSERLLSTFYSLLSVSHPNTIIETIKHAEDGNGIIIRLYESRRKRGPVQLHAGFALKAAWETNLLEENETELRVENNSIQLDLKPYQIMTLRLKPQ